MVAGASAFAGHHSVYLTAEDFDTQAVGGNPSHTETFSTIGGGNIGEVYSSSGNGLEFDISATGGEATESNPNRLHGFPDDTNAEHDWDGWDGAGLRSHPAEASLLFDFTGGDPVTGVGGYFFVTRSDTNEDPNDGIFAVNRTMTLTFSFLDAEDVVLAHDPRTGHQDSFVGLTSEHEITGLLVSVDSGGGLRFAATDEVTAVPEPSTVAFLTSLLAFGVVLLRRRVGGRNRG